MWSKQQGRCYYTNLPMTARPKSEWQCSLERLDPNQGYTVENCVLCCLEMNAPSQWRPDKVAALLIPQPDVDASQVINTGRELPGPRKRKRVTTDEGQQLIECSDCGESMDAEQFERIGSQCKSCILKRKQEYWQTASGHLSQLFQHARSRAKKLTKRGRELEFDIDLEFLKEQYIRQQGRCYYSDMVMSIGGERRRDWMVSLERLDPKIGYIKSNTAIIAHEFNSTFVNWSREKVAIVRQSIASSQT